jgi:diguanylate cyclase (GGDEF)-like protein
LRAGGGGIAWSRVVRIIAWGTPVVGWLWLRIVDLTSVYVPSSLLVLVLGLLFVCLIGRVVAAAITTPERRVALSALALGLVLWSAGSAVLNASSAPEAVAFPAPGEWLFLASYVGLSAFLVFDRAGTSPIRAGGWLEAIIVIGGTACVTLVVLLTPFAAEAGEQGVPLLVGLLFPLLDVVLLLLVVGQVALRQRPADLRSLTLAAGFVVLAIADTSLVASARSGSYQYGELMDLAWCLSFLLLVDAACQRGRRPEPTGTQELRPSVYPVVGASAVALLTLVLQQSSALRWVVDVPALLTLGAAGLRLVLALRQSQQLNDALRLSRTDDLTGLPNRRALDDALRGWAARPGPLALVLLDLDGFKEINDTLGHTAGDAVLRAIAKRIHTEVGHHTLTVRLGGDEFAVLLDDADQVSLVGRAGRLREAVRRPVRVDGIEVSIDVSIGIAVRSPEFSRVSDLLRQADVAMYQAKTSRAGALLYDAGRDDFSRERLQIAEELRHGIDAGEIIAWYQPKVSAGTGRPRGVEALVRWAHHTDGLISPAVFLSVARRAGLMPALTRAVLARVVDDVVAWRREGIEMEVAVNIAPAELLAPHVMNDLFEMVRAARLGPGSLVIEVTEDSFLAEPERAREVIEAIRAEGLEVSIDDYGTGYSSLSYLRDLPVQELKIDMSFVRDVLRNPRNEMIVKTTNELAKGLNLRTVAEGVEDAATAQHLRDLGVDILQGYYFAKPMPAAEIPPWFAERRAAAVTMA